MTITPDHRAQFHDGYWRTIIAPDGVVGRGDNRYYEVTIEGDDGGCIVGWATDEFLTDDKSKDVGECVHSYGYYAQYQWKRHNGNSTRWGVKVPRGTVGYVVGVAINMVKGEILFSHNGKWNPPMGIAFDNIKTNLTYFPAISGIGIKLCMNFGEKDFRYAPPDQSFNPVV